MQTHIFRLLNFSRRFLYTTFLFLIIPPTVYAQNNFWKQTSGPEGGTVTALAISNSGYIFAGTEGGGIFRSTDNGNNWTHVGLTSNYVYSLAINSSGHIFAGTVNGIFRSTDNGNNWPQVGFMAYVSSLAINSSGHIFAGIQYADDIFRSTDNGNSWTQLDLMSFSVWSLAINSSEQIFAGTDQGIFRSTDNGNNWTQIGLTSYYVLSLAINSNGHIFAGTSNHGGIFRTVDNGNNWIQVGLTSYVSVISLAINSSGHIFAGTRDGIFRSHDNGNNWFQIGLPSFTVYSLAINSSGLIFAGTEGDGIFRSHDNGNNWGLINNGLISSILTSLAINSIGHIFAGTPGHGIFRSTDNGNSWVQFGSTLYDHVKSLAINSSGHIFAGTDSWFGDGGIFRSTDNGNNWTQVGLNSYWVQSLAINSSGDIFGGVFATGIFRSTDNGNTWTWIGLASKLVLSFAINNSGHIFAGTPVDGIYRSTNNGNSWTWVGLTSNVVLSLAINSSEHIFAGTGGGIFRSTDNGNSWTQVGLNSYRVESLAINSSGHIFAGTEYDGIFHSTDNGNNWAAINSGLTNPIVRFLAINNSGYVFAGTGGSGVFRSTASTVIPTSPALTSPGNDVLDIPATLNLHWQVSPPAESYHVQVSTAPGFSAFIIDTILTDTTIGLSGLAENTIYYWRVNASNINGTSDWSSPFRFTTISTINLDTLFTFPSLPNASDYKPEDYLLIGLPGESNLAVTDLFSGNFDEDWKVFWDNGQDEDYLVPFSASDTTFRFSTGKGFWAIHKGELNIEKTVTAASLDTSASVTIPLHPGWNIITNPFPKPVSWPAVQDSNAVTHPIYSYQTGWDSLEATFKPYKGYYYLNREGYPFLEIFYPFNTIGNSPLQKENPLLWRVRIILSSEDYTDRVSYIGVAEQAKKDLDQLDYRKPRGLSLESGISFDRPDWDEQYSSFATDIRPPFEELQVWEFTVSAQPGSELELSFKGIGQVPAQFGVHLIDEEGARTVNLRENSTYRFISLKSNSLFKVLVGTETAIAAGIDVVVPREFSLGANYPNPFNSSTIIPVEIPQRSEAELVIYTILGEKVRTLYSGTLEAGRHGIVWDGRNSAGETLSSGIYIYSLKAAGYVNAKKMIFLK